MTNFEKYKDEILEMAREGHSLAKKAGKLTECSKIRCADCDFVHNCRAKFIKWLYAEPAPTLTKRERTFCEIMGEGYIARDEDGTLFYSQNRRTMGSRRPFKAGGRRMRLIDADKLVEGRDEKDTVRIAAMNEPTFVFSMIEEVYDRSYLMEWSKERLVDYAITLAYNNKSFREQINQQYINFRKLLKEAEAKEWIPCSDKLPPDNKINPVTRDFCKYLVTVKIGDIYDVRCYAFGRGQPRK